MKPGFKGFWLGVANVVVVAIGFAAKEARSVDDAAHIFILINLIGILPGMFTGVALGVLAGRLQVARIPILLVLSFAVVLLLGSWTELHQYVVLAWIPTGVATLLLERSTRPVPPAHAPATAIAMT